MGQKRPLMCDAAAMPRIRVISALGADDSAVTDYAPRDGYLPRPRPQCRHCTVLERVLTRPRTDFRGSRRRLSSRLSSMTAVFPSVHAA